MILFLAAISAAVANAFRFFLIAILTVTALAGTRRLSTTIADLTFRVHLPSRHVIIRHRAHHGEPMQHTIKKGP